MLWAAAFLLAGCSTMSPSHYVSPRVIGRVLDMESYQPVEGVRVRRVSDDRSAQPMDAPNGARLLEQSSAVRTGADGRFAVNSLRTLAVFGERGWYSVTLNFEHAGYQSVTRTYTLANSTNAPSGEPLVWAGDVLLPPLGR
jgi:hypothetical protein